MSAHDPILYPAYPGNLSRIGGFEAQNRRRLQESAADAAPGTEHPWGRAWWAQQRLMAALPYLSSGFCTYLGGSTWVGPDGWVPGA